MKLSAIAAMSKNRVIGKAGNLPWRISEDLKRFKSITSGHPVIMGRKTFDSIGRALPRRTNIVITSNKERTFPENVKVCSSLEEALAEAVQSEGADEAFVIGGGYLYRQAISVVDRLYLTLVDSEIEGDTFFPEFDWNQFEIRKKEKFAQTHEESDGVPLVCDYFEMERKK